MLQLRATVTLSSRKVGNFSTCTKCVSSTLSQKCQNGKDLISAHWGVQQLPHSLSPCAPASQGKSLQQGSPSSHSDFSVAVPSGLPQHKTMYTPFSASVELSWYKIWCPQSKAKDSSYSLLLFWVTLDLFWTKKSLCRRSRRDCKVLSERARTPRVTESIIVCSSALLLRSPQRLEKVEGQQQKDAGP